MTLPTPALSKTPALMKWTLWHTLGWIVILGSLAGYEFWAMFDHDARTPMLTQATVRWIPWYVTLPFIVWLFVHFAVRYFNAAYITNLRTF
jgi:hypothetical protein